VKNYTCLDSRYSTCRMVYDIKLPVNAEYSTHNPFVSHYFIDSENKNCGGIRTNGFFKKSNTIPLISVVTVVFNDVEHIESTIKSVLNQSYSNVEYIIIDGGSKDGTVDIIKKYEDKIDYWVSEEDLGIYDAMNKGIDLISGDWVNFMNSGDLFYQDNVLHEMFYESELHSTDVLFGHHQVIYPSKLEIRHAGCINNLWKASQFCHQSAFIRSSIHKDIKFNLSNRIGADFEFFYELSKDSKKFQCKNVIVSSVSSGGLSDIKRIDSIVGRWNVVEKKTYVNFYYIITIVKEMIKDKVKLLLLR
jgi:glycosyltransferase involved in cell wall biosynthesis